MMEWGKASSHQVTVDSSWIQNTIGNIQNNSDAVRPKVLPYGKNIGPVLEINHTVIRSLA